MTPAGAYVAVWQGNGVGDQNGIFARRYTTTTDNAGPMVADYLLPGGSRIDPNNQVIQTQSLSAITVVFDEEMLDTGTTGQDSVRNPANYRLMKDGVEVSGAIKRIDYKLDYDATTNTGTNKYIATITFNTPLSDGHYQIIVRNSVRDKAGNPLQSTGLNPNGANSSRSFDISTLSNTEVRVNVNTAGEQSTSATQRTVASDGSGRSVVVWISSESGKQGVYARTYDALGNPTTNYDIPVSGVDTNAAKAAVAMDGNGDWVVTWSSTKESTPLNNRSWDVYARRYDATGAVKAINGLLDPSLVNASYTEDVQSNSNVAMDADGDFVIVWQSLEQDGSGYGIYAQRYSPSGDPLGGTNKAQLITLVGRPTGSFDLHWEGAGNTDNKSITISGEANETLRQAIQDAMGALGASVDVTVLTSSAIMVRFKDDDGNRDVPQITVVNPHVTGDPGAGSQLARRCRAYPAKSKSTIPRWAIRSILRCR